ncbi:MAG: adenylate/guanylate cyclase domain-containing protein [Flavobacteriales bacterium]|nr:adenylate/guanylate cyclase domain-containing protein [Flavobacteriales bacterium]
MQKHGIEKIKTIGDAYMAAGGLPTPNTTHALDVVKAALEIRDVIAENKARKVAAGLPYFEIRIGIHTGPVVAGHRWREEVRLRHLGRYSEHRQPHGEQWRGGAGEHQ